MVLSKNTVRQPRLSVNELFQMASQLEPDALRDCACDRLPREIPTRLLHEIPERNRSVIEDFIFEISMAQIDEQYEMERIFGPAIHEVLAAASVTGNSYSLRVFTQKVKQLVDHYNGIKAQPNPSHINDFYYRRNQLKESLLDLRMEQTHLRSLYEFAQDKQTEVSADQAHMLETPAAELSRRIHSMDHVIGVYFYVSLCTSVTHMQMILEHVDKCDAISKDLNARLERERFVLEDLSSNIIGRITNKPAILALKSDITQLMEKVRSYDTLVSEETLFRWLDDYVEAQLEHYVQGKDPGKIRRARILLFNLLTKYCNHQEEGAQQVARNPFSRTRPRDAIGFMMNSEKFVLRYFEDKKRELSLWMGNAANKRLHELDSIEKDLLNELKRNRHLR